MEEDLIGGDAANPENNSFDVVFSIVFDEDDNNSLNINLSELFQAPPDKGIYSVKVSSSILG